MELKESGQTDIAVGIAALVVSVSLFLPWFHVTSHMHFLRISVAGSEDGLYNRFALIPLILSALTVLYIVAVRLFGRFPVTFPVTRDQLLAVLGAVTLLMVIVDFADPPGVGFDRSYGAYVGLAAAVVAVAVPVVQTLRLTPELRPAALRSLRRRSG